MPTIVSHDEVKGNRKQRDLSGGHAQWRTDFIKPKGDEESPQALLSESTPHRSLRTHYHQVDQFQIIVKGDGFIGKHPVAVHGVHFTRAYTPYGPIVNGDKGIGFLTLRVRRDWGLAQYMPEAREKLTSVSDRNPWQITELGRFIDGDDSSIHTFERIKDERGLAAFALKLKPNAVMAAPDPSRTEGQYVVVIRGSLIHETSEYKAISIALVKPEEGPMRLEAGGDGLEVLVLNYPRQEAAAMPARAARTRGDFRVWQCALCAFSYDEARGMPEEGIAAGTRWEDVPETWSCPDCSTGKSDFQMQVVG